MADDVQRDSKTPKAPLNIPAGNSPITPDAERAFNPAEEQLTGDFWGDRIKALKRVSLDDFERAKSMPCLRESSLYAIAGGAGLGAIRFLGTRRVHNSCTWAVLGGCAIAIGSWEMCNRQRREELANMRMIQEKFPHRHISNLKKRGQDWQPPKDDSSSA